MAPIPEEDSWWRELRDYCSEWLDELLQKLKRGHLWQRIVKVTLCTTLAIIIGLIPQVIDVYGYSTYLIPMVAVFSHPGQRFGKLVEAVSLVVSGTAVGMGWSLLGLYLSSLALASNVSAAYGIKAVFFVLSLMLHGVLRSSAPRLFMFVFFMLLISLTNLTGSATAVSATGVTQILYPLLTGVGMCLLVNIAVFPEFSSSFLGTSTIESLYETISCLEDTCDWFLLDSREKPKDESELKTKEKTHGNSDDNTEEKAEKKLRVKLAALTDGKPKLRAQLASSKSEQSECNFEIVYAVLPPQSLKPISTSSMERLVHHTISLINACESKYALTGDPNADLEEENSEKDTESEDDDDDEDEDDDSSDESSDESSSESEPKDREEEEKSGGIRRKSKHMRNIELVKPLKEIELGDAELLEQILCHIRAPTQELQKQIRLAVQVITASLAYCYDVPKLPLGTPRPRGISLEEFDIHLTILDEAIGIFDVGCAQALEAAAALAYGENAQVDLMPRMETHLVSSFLLNLRGAAVHILETLRYSRTLIEEREGRRGRRKIYFPKISWKKWLTSGGELDGRALPENARKEARVGRGIQEDTRNQDDGIASNSMESLVARGDKEALGELKNDPSLGSGDVKIPIPSTSKPPKAWGNRALRIRSLAADAIEFVADSESLGFAMKMCIAGMLVTWPAFVPQLNPWYAWVRGSWASLQLVLVFEVSVGTSFMGFFLRALGVIFGCLAGYLAYKIGEGNRIVAVVILVICIIPSAYIQLATPYVKTGIISIVSMSVVALAIIVQTGTDTWEIFLKRLVCFLVGGTVALLVELILFPVRARDRLVESVASSIKQISQMEASVAIGVDSPINIKVKSIALNDNFTNAKRKAEQALSAAQTFLPFTLSEPRLKGSYKGKAMIFGEIIYVLFQIIDRMDSLLETRKAYGSSILEEYHAQVYPYRRNVAASITLTLFAVHEALTTRLPLPQFLPSCRVAQLRYISRVREVLLEPLNDEAVSDPQDPDGRKKSVVLSPQILKTITKPNFLSWNAGSAGLMEVVEYLEELVDLTKLLVGVNAFRSGLLERPKFEEYAKKIKAREQASAAAAQELAVERIKSANSATRKKRGFSFGRSQAANSAGRKRSRTIGADDAAPPDEDAVADELPMSLQRVRTKRLEGKESERTAKTTGRETKGKAVLRGARTWEH